MENILQSIFDESYIWLPKLGSALLIFLAFLIFAYGVKKGVRKAMQKMHIDNHLVTLLARMANITLIIIGLITALGTLGVDVTAIVAGLGLTGFALGFALKDTISNLLSGILILFYQPFKIGDKIKIAGFEGEVMEIDLRYTELSSEGVKVLIPNSKLFTDPITVIIPDQNH